MLGTRREYPPFVVNTALGNLISKGTNSEAFASVVAGGFDIWRVSWVEVCGLKKCILNDPATITNPAAATITNRAVCLFMFIRTMAGHTLV